MALQKRIINDRYQDFTKQWLINNKVRVFIDGVDTTDIPTQELNKHYKRFEIYQWSTLQQKYVLRPIVPNTKLHEKGKIGKCTYYQVNITSGTKGHRKSQGIPLHRIVYVWFNDILPAYNNTNEKLEILHNYRYHNDYIKDNHILNLRLDTAKQNRAERQGAINQYR